jgi:hypothetical protein
MTNTDSNPNAQKLGRFRQFRQVPWHLYAAVIVFCTLGQAYLWPKANLFLVGGALYFCAIAALLVKSRLRDRLTKKKNTESQGSVDTRTAIEKAETSTSRAELRVDFWTVAVPLFIVFAIHVARVHGWLGSNAPDRTDWILTLGLVFIWGVTRLWWRSRKPHSKERHEDS